MNEGAVERGLLAVVFFALRGAPVNVLEATHLRVARSAHGRQRGALVRVRVSQTRAGMGACRAGGSNGATRRDPMAKD